MSVYLKDLQENLYFLFRKGPEINPGAFAFIMRYLSYAILSLLVSVIGLILDCDLSLIILLQIFAILINIFIGRKLLKRLRHPELFIKTTLK